MLILISFMGTCNLPLVPLTLSSKAETNRKKSSCIFVSAGIFSYSLSMQKML